MNSQKSTSYKYLLIFITIILILIGCTVKNDIKTSQKSGEITSTQDEPAKLLKDINLTKTGNQNTVTLLANNTLTYTVFKLSKPDRILIDLQDITAAPSLTGKLIKNELITNITWSEKQYNNDKFLRLEIELSSDVTYNASRKGNLLNKKGTCIIVGFSSILHIINIMGKAKKETRKGEFKIMHIGMAVPGKEVLNDLSELMESGKLVPAIDSVYPLEDLANAMRYFEDGHPKAKVVIKVDSDA